MSSHMRGVAPALWDNPNGTCSSFTMKYIISKKMQENDIVVRMSEPVYLKYFHMRVIGHFYCKLCGNTWTCYNATIVVDTHKHEVSKKYKQYCRSCKELCDGLYFTNKQFERIVDRVITHYKKRKETGGTVPAIENNGSYSSKAFQPHEEHDCERCFELDEPCWLHLVPYIKKVPYNIAHLIHSPLSKIDESLKKLCASANMEVNDVSKVCRIHINPLSGSEKIKQWRRQCETLLESFLQNFSSVSLSVQPDLSKRVVISHSKPSLSVELQTVLHIAGDKRKVSEAFKIIESSVKEITRQHETEKRKPCIIPC